MRLLAILAAFALGSCVVQPVETDPTPNPAKLHPPGTEAEAAIDRALAEAGIVTAGLGVVQNGELVWSHYFGAESPGVPAGAQTRFNVASISKTITAETALRLVAEGKLDLDAPLSGYWIDPDLADDPRLPQLTARMALNHTTGFPNWRFFRSDGKLAFEHDPGTTHGYSGEGFEYLARAIEKKVGQPFPTIVQATVFDPVGMTNSVVRVDREHTEHMARPVDAEGTFHGYYCRPGGWCREDGSYSAADDMMLSVPDYARFLGALSQSESYGEAITSERDRVQTDRGDERLIDCAANPPSGCPIAQGYGLGFEVADFGDYRAIGHTGSDWSEQSVAYVYEPTGDGVIMFLNAPNEHALAAIPEVLKQIDPTSPFLPRYQKWLDDARAAGSR